MSRALANRAYPSPSHPSAPEKDLRDGFETFKRWHWGVGAAKVFEVPDPHLPDVLVQCGRLVALDVHLPRDRAAGKIHPRRDYSARIEFPRADSRNCHALFDPTHARGRLYCLTPPNVMRDTQERFWTKNEVSSLPLGALAQMTGGYHGKDNDYPPLRVKLCGVLENIIYYTHKKGDENPTDKNSFYIHRFGEVSGRHPTLACDARGGLWLAGGNYDGSPTGGITD